MSWWIALMLLQGSPVAQEPVSDVELAAQRGGLRLPNGLDLTLTVQTQTAVNGGVVLRTVYQIDQGAPTLAIYAPAAGATVPQEAAGSGAQAASAFRSPTITFDRASGVHVTPAIVTAPLALSVGTAKSGAALQSGLAQVAPGAVTDAGTVSESAINGIKAVSLTAADLTVTHLTGNAFGTAIINSGSDRTIDTQTSISIDLGNFSPDILGSAMFRVQDIALDAVALRTGG